MALTKIQYIKIKNKNKQKTNSLNYKWRAAESLTERVFMNFVRATTIEALPHGLSNELLKTAHIKSTKSKKFETNLKKVGNY